MSTVATTQRPQRRAVALAIQFPAVRTVPRARHHVGFRPYATVRTERTATCGLTTVRPTRATHMNRIKPSHDFRALGWIVAWSYPEGVPVCAPPWGRGLCRVVLAEVRLRAGRRSSGGGGRASSHLQWWRRVRTNTVIARHAQTATAGCTPKAVRMTATNK